MNCSGCPFTALLCLFLLGTTSIPYFCIWNLEESSSPGNPAVQENVPSVMHDSSQFRVWMNVQPGYPKDPQVQSSGSFSSGTSAEIMDCARPSSVYQCKCFEVRKTCEDAKGKTTQCAADGMGTTVSNKKKNLKNLKNLQNLAAVVCMVIPVLIHESCSDHCSEVFL